MSSSKRTFGKYNVIITNGDKLLFPSITKKELIDYYQTIASYILPYLKNRPLMMHRWPDGIFGESFYQKDASSYFPSWIKQAQVPKEGGYNHYVVCQNTATLIYLVNQACITPHIWLSKIANLHYPDQLIFDLDPSDAHFNRVQEVAFLLKELLESLGLSCYVMTTGSHGAHVRVPLNKTAHFDIVKLFADHCAQLLLKKDPTNITTEIRKDKRGSRVFIDTLRNQYGATAVAPYAVRAHKTAPVATPLYWKEFENKKLTSQSYTVNSLVALLKSRQDPWQTFYKSAKSLKKAQALLQSLL